jgi:nucleotide-binding universal stress UspA family protein
MSTLTVEKAQTKQLTMRRIIAALDLKKNCERTLVYAAKLAKLHHASLYVAYVFWPRMLSERERYYWVDKQQTELKHELDKLVNHVRGIAPESKSTFLVGEPADRITALARDSHADLIITTSYHRPFITGFPLLDQAIKIARQAPCSVLVYQEEDVPWDS